MDCTHKFINPDGTCHICGVLFTTVPGHVEGHTLVDYERFFILTPTPTDRKMPNSLGQEFPVYLDAQGMEMKWSGATQPPQIGDRVYMSINSIGYGKVVGYFESRGYLGLMVDPEAAPDWYKRQVGERVKEHALAVKLGPEKAKLERVREQPEWICKGIGCVFGSEFRLQKEVSQ